MKILFLYGNDNALNLADWLKDQQNEVVVSSLLIDVDWLRMSSFDLIISYTYRHMISKECIEIMSDNIINLHISFLPWNQGSDPNMWSWIDNTPKGVTIHYVSSKLDAGDIIVQRITKMSTNETLSSSYDKLSIDIVSLFKEIYPLYPYWNDMRKRALGKGTYHRSASLAEYKKTLDSFDILVSSFCELYHNR